jgi:hypothetical protein
MPDRAIMKDFHVLDRFCRDRAIRATPAVVAVALNC